MEAYERKNYPEDKNNCVCCYVMEHTVVLRYDKVLGREWCICTGVDTGSGCTLLVASGFRQNLSKLGKTFLEQGVIIS